MITNDFFPILLNMMSKEKTKKKLVKLKDFCGHSSDLIKIILHII